MFNSREFERTKSILSQVGSAHYRELNEQHHIHLKPKDLLKWIELMKEDLGYFTLVDLLVIDKGVDTNFRFELVYQFLSMGDHQRIMLHLECNEDELVPSVVHFYPHAEWLEREQAENFGVKFSINHPPLFLPKGTSGLPLRKDAQDLQWSKIGLEELPKLQKNPNKSEAPFPEENYIWKKFDVLSPVTAGNFEWWICLDPQTVVNSQVKVGFHYQGFEKLLESKDWIQSMHLVDRINLNVAPTYSLAWARNLEKQFSVNIPERAQAIRIVMLELVRIVEHLTVMHEMLLSLKMDEHRLFLNAREKIYELIEKYCGHRQGLSIARLGGVREDLPHGWIVEYQSIAEIVIKNLHLLHNSLITKKNFRENLSGGIVSAQTVLNWGVSGPAMRASGLNFDLRKSQPFYFYQDIDFEVPVGIHGTSYDRYLIRFEEILQSFRIITQVIDNLPLGETIHPEFASDLLQVAGLIQKKGITREVHYLGLESPNGEAGFSLLLDNSNQPYRVKIKTPSVALTQALPFFVMGLKEEQLKTCLSSLGIRRYELDR